MRQMSLVIMENLKEHEIMRERLVARKHHPHFADQISAFLDNSLFSGPKRCLSGRTATGKYGLFGLVTVCPQTVSALAQED
jgi:5-methylthioribose kinase